MPARGVGQDLARRQFAAGFERTEPLLARRTLVAQLDDVDATGQGGVGELGQVTAFPAGVGAQVEPGISESGETVRAFVHTATLAASLVC